MSKIAYIGAGSGGFASYLIVDILNNPVFSGSHLVLMDISSENLDINYRFAKKAAAQFGSGTTLEATTDLTAALDGADYVFDTTLRHGSNIRYEEEMACRRHGVNIYSGCTSGPAGVFRGLREIPAIMEMLGILERVCPKAYYLHYTNPTNIVSLALGIASPIKSVGLCHSVEETAKYMSRCLDIPFDRVAYRAGGVNHQNWILELEKDGQDLYPAFRALYNTREIYNKQKVRFEIMKFFGYFPTESSSHNSEYVPYFRKTPEMAEAWTGANIDHAEEGRERERVRARVAAGLDKDEPVPVHEHSEFCIRIIEAIQANKTFCFYGNVLNKGIITNLPSDIAVEVPIMVDGTGWRPCFVGDLPPQCAALNANRSAGDFLAAKGGLEGDKEAVLQAVALDPMTACALTLDQIRALAAELFEVDKEFLPQFK